MPSVKAPKHEEIHERRYGVVRRSVPVDQAVLHILFPLEAYWRNVTIRKKVGEKIVNLEGQVYPSFSDIVFPADFKIEMVDAEQRNKFLIHHARGYAPCPVCGRGIVAVLENYEYTTASRVKRFMPEVAYEIVASALAKELSARMKAHIQFKHKYFFSKIGETPVIIVRFTGGQYVTFEAKISEYRCPHDNKSDIVGVYGILDHLVTHHEHTDKAREVLEFINRLADTTSKIFGLKKEDIPILGAYRNVFTYTLVDRGSGENRVKVLAKAWFKPWLRAEVVERRDDVRLVVYASIPRPIRMIYHYPLFRYVPHVLAYKIDSRKYIDFIERARDRLDRLRYPTRRLDAMLELVTGAFAYSKVEPRNAFEIDLDTLENLRRIVEKVGEVVKVFAR